MIIRKPYAFLIMNFRKIHILLLLISIFIYISTLSVNDFVNNFLEFGSYNATMDSVTNYLNIFVFLGLFILVLLPLGLILLLKRKGKPWLVYLFYVILYSFLIITFFIVINFFSTYTGGSDSTVIRFIGDLLFIGTFPQYLVFILLLIRVIGLDLNKFDFRNDSEFLELDSDDREEVELNIDFDKHAIIRMRRRIFRNIGYFYTEYKFIVNAVLVISTIVISISVYNYFFIVHKIYKEGEVFSNDRYDIVINNSYITDVDYNNNVIEAGKKFIIVDVSVLNKLNKVEIDLSKYHLLYEDDVFNQSTGTYSDSFIEFGKFDSSEVIDENENKRFMLVYKVDLDIEIDDVLLYYQDYDDSSSYIRRVDLDIQEFTDVKLVNEVNILEDLKFELVDGTSASLQIDSVEYGGEFDYGYEVCSFNGDCYIKRDKLIAKEGTQIMKLSFVNVKLDDNKLFDFFDNYGTIIYKDTNNVEQEVELINLVDKNSYSNYVYVSINDEIINSTELKVGFKIRDEKYYIKLR